MACPTYCGKVCDWIFADISAWPTIEGGTRVDWTMHPRFGDPQPHIFQLQFGRTDNLQADDWIDVGSSVANGYYAVDSQKRVYGTRQWTHYRIKLVTENATYISSARSLYGNLGRRYWNIAKEIERKEVLRLKNDAGQRGYLLKRRLFGEPCTCLDHQTGEISNPQCSLCYGTGFLNGYYAPVPCVYAELSQQSHRSHVNTGGRGADDTAPVVSGRFLARPQIYSYDVWVDKDTDMRWRIHTVKNIVELQGFPVVVQAELRLIQYSHPVYKIAMPVVDDFEPWIPSKPVTNFTASSTSGAAPLTVQFTDTSSYDVFAPNKWVWDFGDGTSSNLQNPSHTYSAAGTYTVTLSAENIHGIDIEVKDDYITVS